MRLTIWMKTGIVLSVLWAVAASIYMHNTDVERTKLFVDLAYKNCTAAKTAGVPVDLATCDKEKIANTNIWMTGSGMNMAFAALLPIPLGWLVGCILLYLFRIQLAGIRVILPWNELSRKKRAFALFCVVVTGISILVGYLMVMNLYTDREVPVTLSPFADVTKMGVGMVRVTGTWTRHGATERDAIANPLQTSTIDCNQEEKRCFEARASVSSNILTSELNEYEIQTWTKDSIVLKNDGLCFQEIYTIDLNTKMVSGAGRPVNSDTEYCKAYPISEKSWAYRMESGLSVYWELRKKAQPTLMRIIAAMFGNA